MNQTFPIRVRIGHKNGMDVSAPRKRNGWLHGFVGPDRAVIEFEDGEIEVVELEVFWLIAHRTSPTAFSPPEQFAHAE